MHKFYCGLENFVKRSKFLKSLISYDHLLHHNSSAQLYTYQHIRSCLVYCVEGAAWCVLESVDDLIFDSGSLKGKISSETFFNIECC